jgi:riboflavin kinase/FMN adenylyltransferase
VIEIFEDWRAIPGHARGASVALGNFDGVHRGHRAVIAAAHAARPDLPLGVVTFEPHPRAFFRPDDPPCRLTLPDERAALLEKLGVRFLYQLRFDRAFSELSAESFIEDVLIAGLGARHLACGPDFAFGHRRGGDVRLLTARAEAHGVGVSVVPKLADEEGPVSSTRIRRLLKDGYPDRAARLLGRYWSIARPVERGDRFGHELGFPTANLTFGPYLEPARGIYVVRATLPDGRMRDGVANVGRRPTLGGDPLTRCEVFLFDFEGDLYGAALRVFFLAYLHEEIAYPGLEALKAGIAADVETARRWFATHSLPSSFPELDA